MLEAQSGTELQPVELQLSSHISRQVTTRTASLALWASYFIPFVARLTLLIAAHST